ncbi:MAG: transglycosylase SLT domain-containing protein [Methylococcales bacterium]|jgi:membrane-bound lytic murein transglycosylase F|nr:transglycosylase SLT domain-containing protein [Methylococcales bacterium]MBT7409807.1 transglycosylase SLT domain-containing protein [Methylococcales bacterium]
MSANNGTKYPIKYLKIFCLLLIIPSVVYANHAKKSHWPSRFDPYFKKYAKYYFGPNFDWRWFKAQGIAESGLQPKAKSVVGAKGIMQIMPATFAEIKNKNRRFASVNTPRWNIAAGIYYDKQLYKRWKVKLKRKEKLTYTFASYNAGYGNIHKALNQLNRKLKRDKEAPLTWQEIKKYAPKETRNYIKRIKKFKKDIAYH